MKYVHGGGKGGSSVRNSEKIREIVMHAKQETTRATCFHPLLASSRPERAIAALKNAEYAIHPLKTARDVWLTFSLLTR